MASHHFGKYGSGKTDARTNTHKKRVEMWINEGFPDDQIRFKAKRVNHSE